MSESDGLYWLFGHITGAVILLTAAAAIIGLMAAGLVAGTSRDYLEFRIPLATIAKRAGMSFLVLVLVVFLLGIATIYFGWKEKKLGAGAEVSAQIDEGR